MLDSNLLGRVAELVRAQNDRVAADEMRAQLGVEVSRVLHNREHDQFCMADR